MLCAISGAQGQGKSTVISDLVDMGYYAIENKTSRSILRQWDYTLDEVNRDLKLKRKFQDEILIKHHEHSKPAIDSPHIYFIERSYADIFAYALVSLGPFNDYSHWIDEYYNRCLELQKTSFQCVFHISGRDIEPASDGVRSVNKHFAGMINDAIIKYSCTFNFDNFYPVFAADRMDRVNIIDKYLSNGERL